MGVPLLQMRLEVALADQFDPVLLLGARHQLGEHLEG